MVEQKVRNQKFAQPGQALLDILDDSVLELDFVVPSKWLVWLKPGHSFQVAIDETGKSYPVKLTHVGARIDPVSQSVRITGAIGGRFPELSAGMSGKVLLSPPS
ncbi:membrane-fusion protein [Magnetospirillum fulvum MGU-K5]|uniref:Membrane-fusion protein n=1 Tax=Magnetospirillum fulvum MGU-K5 TaxID=1316936 RepID=S9TU82_MAGFU|nr:membrane-fusion protein [Magnetospirillum fulvum MGU-K5]